MRLQRLQDLLHSEGGRRAWLLGLPPCITGIERGTGVEASDKMLMVTVLLLVQVAFETIQNEVVLFDPNLCPIWQAVGLAAFLRSKYGR